MKKIQFSLGVFGVSALIAVFVFAALAPIDTQPSWKLIDAHKFPQDLEDNEAEMFASHVADLALNQYPSLTEGVKNQLHKFITQLVLEVNYSSFKIEQLEIKTETLKKRIELLEQQ